MCCCFEYHIYLRYWFSIKLDQPALEGAVGFPLICHSNPTVKPVLSRHSKGTLKIGFQDCLSPNAGHKYCRMLQEEHSAILLTFIKLPFVIKTLVLSIFEWPLKTGFTVHLYTSSVRGAQWLSW